MFGFLKARFQLRAINTLLDTFHPDVRADDPVDRLMKVLVHHEARIKQLTSERDQLRRIYEPTRERMRTIGGTVVQPLGIGKSPAERW